ncbi:LOW QUALITY PROTEIN: hypothetical protein PHMEG_00021509 [Phytophthora megakarya]|uniref:DDE Tnp4 domain-containing protein n=1 Tax=Phytophthora megakarya TaxID=4795 RepID=A0A225VLP6_9STRA|nr:LOW QUALITY PROTEIN: hypothetical protein PHMEG_00021509 [Phytophthora megakarya]
MQMINFAEGEFYRPWQVVEDFVMLRWNVGRGEKCKFGGKDVIVMALASLKHCSKWDVMASGFAINPPKFQKTVLKYVPMLSHSSTSTSSRISAKWGMRELVVAGKNFSNFQSACYTTDVTFQEAYIPSGLCESRSIYYSGKHSIHGYKVNVLADGQGNHCTQHYPGHVSDIEVFRKILAFHSQNLQKSPSTPDEWALLADKGYQGLSTHFRAITPHKKQPCETLLIEQLNETDRISHDRVLVENDFGRSYDILFKSCVALTNHHVHLNPMRAEDGDHYHTYLSRLLLIGVDAIAIRMLSQKHYQKRREMRLRSVFCTRRGSSESRGRRSYEASEFDSDETIFSS